MGHPDDQEIRTILRELAKERNLLTQDAPTESGLGLRGFVIEILDDELRKDSSLSRRLYLAAGAQARSTCAIELAERLISLMDRAKPSPDAAEDPLPLDAAALRSFLTAQLERVSGTSITDVLQGPTAAAPEEMITRGGTVTCTIELATYNPGFWNNVSICSTVE